VTIISNPKPQKPPEFNALDPDQTPKISFLPLESENETFQISLPSRDEFMTENSPQPPSATAPSLEPAEAVRLRANLPKIYLIGFLNSLHFVSAVLVPFFTDWGGIVFHQIMILQSIFTGAIFLFEVPAGILSDRTTRKRTLMLSYGINSLAIFVYTLYPSFWVFMCGEILWALAAALSSGTQSAFIYDTLKALGQEKESKRIFGKMGSISIFGLMLATFLGSWIAANWGLRITMQLISIPMLISFMIAFSLREPPIMGSDGNTSRKSPVAILRAGLHLIRDTKALQRLTADFVIIGVLGYFMIWLYQPRLAQLGVNIRYFGTVNTIFVIIEVILMNTFIPLEKLMNSKKRVITFTAGGVGVGFLLAALTSNLALVIIGIVICSGIAFARPVLMDNYLNKFIPSEERATTLSAIQMVRMFFIMLFNPIIGFAAEWSIPLLMILLGVITLVWTMVSPVKATDLID
jgi:MFS family permease